MSILISIVIPTYNRAKYLTKAIQSLVDQNMPKDIYEIIVVDNCSTDPTKEVVKQFSSMGNIVYIYEPTLGAPRARNTGWYNARGKYVAYLDDDAIAYPTWLDKIVEVFETVTPRPGCVGGRVEPIWEASRPIWLSDSLLHGLAIINWSDTPHFLSDLSQEWLVSVNMAFPVEILKRLGGFTPSLDRVGSNLLSSGEVFLEKKIIETGYSCFYHPDVAVKHHIVKSRLNKSWFIRRYYWQGISDAAMQLIEETLSKMERTQLAIAMALRLLQSPRNLMNLIQSRNDPKQFTEKCFTLIKVGHIVGLLGKV